MYRDMSLISCERDREEEREQERVCVSFPGVLFLCCAIVPLCMLGLMRGCYLSGSKKTCIYIVWLLLYLESPLAAPRKVQSLIMCPF